VCENGERNTSHRLYQKSKTLNYNNGSRAHSDEKGEKKNAQNGIERRKRRGKSAKKK